MAEMTLCVGLTQKEDEDLAVTRFGGVLQVEWFDFVAAGTSLGM